MPKPKLRKKAKEIRKAANREKIERNKRFKNYEKWWGQLNEIEADAHLRLQEKYGIDPEKARQEAEADERSEEEPAGNPDDDREILS